jgi:hypothetical protein
MLGTPLVLFGGLVNASLAVCPDLGTITNAISKLRSADWSTLSSDELRAIWPQELLEDGASPSSVHLSSLTSSYSPDCVGASFLLTKGNGTRLRDFKVMVPAESEKDARQIARQATLAIQPPKDASRSNERDPWVEYYNWFSREDCGPRPRGCLLSTLELQVGQDQRHWVVVILWSRTLFD